MERDRLLAEGRHWDLNKFLFYTFKMNSMFKYWSEDAYRGKLDFRNDGRGWKRMTSQKTSKEIRLK